MPPVGLAPGARRVAEAFNRLGWSWWPAELSLRTGPGPDACNNCGPCELHCPRRAKGAADLAYCPPWPVFTASLTIDFVDGVEEEFGGEIVPQFLEHLGGVLGLEFGEELACGVLVERFEDVVRLQVRIGLRFVVCCHRSRLSSIATSVEPSSLLSEPT